MGDGAGIMLQIPDKFFARSSRSMGYSPRRGRVRDWYGFLPKEQGARLACERAIERAIIEEGQVLLGWRTVPVNSTIPMSPE